MTIYIKLPKKLATKHYGREHKYKQKQRETRKEPKPLETQGERNEGKRGKNVRKEVHNFELW